MATFFHSLLGAKATKTPPARVQTDTVFPVRFFDDSTTLRGIIMAWMFRIDDVLDPEKLHEAMLKLLDIPSWRHLGGRLRLSNKGTLEIHVPEKFTPDRPSVRFSHVELATRLDDHPLASQLPKATLEPSLQPGAGTFKMFGARDGAPRTLDDYLYTDEPQISMHITSFSDTTLVSLLLPHTMTDAMGISTLLSALSMVLAGRTSEVPDLPDPSHDTLKDVGTAEHDYNPEPYALADKAISGMSGVRFGLNFAWDTISRSNMQSRTGFLPASFVAKLRTAAVADLLKNPSDSKPAFLSDGDILTAWGATMILSSEPRPRPAILMNILNVRGRLQSSANLQGAFVQNLVFSSNTLLSTEEVATARLGSVAAKVRTALAQQTTEPQIHAIVRESRAGYLSTGNPPLFGDPSARLIVINNWNKCKMFDAVDFSPAVMGIKDSDHNVNLLPRGRLSYYHAFSMKESSNTRHFWNIVGKDLKGDYWFSGVLLPETWRAIEEAISS